MKGTKGRDSEVGGETRYMRDDDEAEYSVLQKRGCFCFQFCLRKEQ